MGWGSEVLEGKGSLVRRGPKSNDTGVGVSVGEERGRVVDRSSARRFCSSLECDDSGVGDDDGISPGRERTKDIVWIRSRGPTTRNGRYETRGHRRSHRDDSCVQSRSVRR